MLSYRIFVFMLRYDLYYIYNNTPPTCFIKASGSYCSAEFALFKNLRVLLSCLLKLPSSKTLFFDNLSAFYF